MRLDASVLPLQFRDLRLQGVQVIAASGTTWCGGDATTRTTSTDGHTLFGAGGGVVGGAAVAAATAGDPEAEAQAHAAAHHDVQSAAACESQLRFPFSRALFFFTDPSKGHILCIHYAVCLFDSNLIQI